MKIDIFLALHDQSHALASLTRLLKSSKRKNEEEGLEWPKAAIVKQSEIWVRD